MDFPLRKTGPARIVAEGSHCAGDQGKFWEYHYKAFEQQAKLDKGSPESLAKELKLNLSKFKKCVSSGKGKQMVDKAYKQGNAAGVTGTPSFFVNGIKVGHSHSGNALEEAIENAM